MAGRGLVDSGVQWCAFATSGGHGFNDERSLTLNQWTFTNACFRHGWGSLLLDEHREVVWRVLLRLLIVTFVA